SAIASLGGSALGLIAALVAGYLSFKYWQRRRLLRELRMARISVSELRRKQEEGEVVVVLDLRSATALQQDPIKIPGALQVSLDDIKSRKHTFSPDREVVVYCSCPNEE